MIIVQGYDGTPFNQNHVDAGGAGRFIRTFLKLALSANYVTGGDPLDLTNAVAVLAAAATAAQAPNTIPQGAGGGVVDIDVTVRTVAGGLVAGGGFWAIKAPNAHAPLTFADLANLKLMAFKDTAGSVAEYGNGAYGADALADVIILEVVYAR